MPDDLAAMAKRSESIDTVGFVWPIITSLLGLLLVLLIVFLLWLFNSFFPTRLVQSIIDLIYANIGLIFVMSVAFNYGAYLYKFSPPTSAVAPLITSIGAVFLVFFILSILRILVPDNVGLVPLIDLIQGNLLLIFAVLLAAGYAVYFLRITRSE